MIAQCHDDQRRMILFWRHSGFFTSPSTNGPFERVETPNGATLEGAGHWPV
jgi:hypothetical protein